MKIEFKFCVKQMEIRIDEQKRSVIRGRRGSRFVENKSTDGLPLPVLTEDTGEREPGCLFLSNSKENKEAALKQKLAFGLKMKYYSAFKWNVL